MRLLHGEPPAGSVSERFVFASASALDPTTMKRVPEAVTVADEVRVCFARIEAALKEAGLTLADLAKTRCWINDEAIRMDFIYAYRDVLAPGPFPSRASFVIGLPGDARVQIDAIAARPN